MNTSSTLSLETFIHLIQKSRFIPEEEKARFIKAVQDGIVTSDMHETLLSAFKKDAELLESEVRTWEQEKQAAQKETTFLENEKTKVLEAANRESNFIVSQFEWELDQIEQQAVDKMKSTAAADDAEKAEEIRKNLGLSS